MNLDDINKQIQLPLKNRAKKTGLKKTGLKKTGLKKIGLSCIN